MIEFDVCIVQVLEDASVSSDAAQRAHSALCQHVCKNGRVPLKETGTQWRGDLHRDSHLLALRCRDAGIFHALDLSGMHVCDDVAAEPADGPRMRDYTVYPGRLATAMARAVDQHVRWSASRRAWMQSVVHRVLQ